MSVIQKISRLLKSTLEERQLSKFDAQLKDREQSFEFWLNNKLPAHLAEGTVETYILKAYKEDLSEEQISKLFDTKWKNNTAYVATLIEFCTEVGIKLGQAILQKLKQSKVFNEPQVQKVLKDNQNDDTYEKAAQNLLASGRPLDAYYALRHHPAITKYLDKIIKQAREIEIEHKADIASLLTYYELIVLICLEQEIKVDDLEQIGDKLAQRSPIWALVSYCLAGSTNKIKQFGEAHVQK